MTPAPTDPRQSARRSRPGERVRRDLRHRRRRQDRAPRRPPGGLSRQRSAGARQRLDQPAVAGVRRVPRLSRLGLSRGSTRSPTTSSIFQNGVLQDRDNAHTNLWGVYGSYDLPKFAVGRRRGRRPRSICSISAGAPAPFANGKGSAIYNDAAFLTGARIVAATGAGFVTSQDHRDTFGLRGYGELGCGRLRLAGRLADRQLCRAAGRRLRVQHRHRLHLSRSAVEAAHRRPYRRRLGRRRQGRRHDAHLSADVPEHAVLRAEQRVRADQFLRFRAADQRHADRYGHGRILLLVPVALFASATRSIPARRGRAATARTTTP